MTEADFSAIRHNNIKCTLENTMYSEKHATDSMYCIFVIF